LAAFGTRTAKSANSFFDLEHELGKHDKYDNEDDIIYNE
jgi:hypothetical protein